MRMHTRVAAALIALLTSQAAFSVAAPSSAAPSSAALSSAAPSAAAPYTATPFKEGLAFPAAFTFAPDGRVFYGERFSGQIHILSADASTDSPFFTVSGVVGAGEDGLLGLALDPNYPATPYVYAYVTRQDGGAKNEIVRITDTAGTGGSMQVLFSSDKTPGQYHDGGRIRFGPDGKLYAVVGDAHNSSNAQSLSTVTGKILRMNSDGSVPGDNPFPGKLIYAYGVRNSFGFAFDPLTDRLWESENGPECNDELNRIPKGRNMGWGPNENCNTPPKAPRNTNQDGPSPVLPKLFFHSPPSLTGVAFCSSCGLTGGEGKLFMGSWNTGVIRRIRLDGDRRSVDSAAVGYTHDDGVISMETAPDGALYFSDPDGIYRLIPA